MRDNSQSKRNPGIEKPLPPPERMTRRDLCKRGALTAGGIVALPGLQGLMAPATRAASSLETHGAQTNPSGYGPLKRKRPVATSTSFPGASEIEWLALPHGFEYVVFGVAGDLMSDGYPTPSAHDGMAAFQTGSRRHRLVRNHENRDHLSSAHSTPMAGALRAYDARGAGGATTLELRVNNSGVPELVKSFVSLNGTIVNCAGGPTPQQSWISCEETTETRNGIKHGYGFEVPSAAKGPVEPIPLTAMGRFSHEAIAVDPGTGLVFETEDAGDCGFYQFVPKRAGHLHDGILQMLKVTGERNSNLTGSSDRGGGPEVGEPLAVEWVTIRHPDPMVSAWDQPKAVYNQGIEAGAAFFSRLEGCWYNAIDRSIVFSSTDGGRAQRGQIWQYKPLTEKEGVLQLLFESPDGNILAAPDNLTASPGGGLLLCEDHSFDRPKDPFGPLPWSPRRDDDAVEVHYLKGLTEQGEIFDFVANALDDKEWAGACFSHDGNFLFANTQGATSDFDFNDMRPQNLRNFGRSYAIWGPWKKGAFGPNARFRR